MNIFASWNSFYFIVLLDESTLIQYRKKTSIVCPVDYTAFAVSGKVRTELTT